MKEHRNRQNRDQIEELLTQYQNLKEGRGYTFIDEDAFEKIITHFEEKEDIASALEASELAIERYPYSSALLIKKADILLTRRQYKKALEILEHASLFDSRDINLYILKTDAFLAIDQQEKAVKLLQE